MPAAPLRIAIDARVPDGAYGGVQQWILGLAHALSSIDAGAEEYLFFSVAGSDAWLRPYVSGPCRIVQVSAPGATARSMLRRRVAALPGARAAWRAAHRLAPSRPAVPVSDGSLERSRADVIHFPHQSGFLTDVPSIYQPWDLQHRHLPSFFSPQERIRRDITYRAFCSQAATVVTASRWVKRDLVQQYALDPGRIAVVNVPPATEAYRVPGPADIDATRQRLRLPERFIYYPAQTWPHKNHERLFLALAALREVGIKVPLICSGHPNEHHRGTLRAARRAGVADQVQFVGFLAPAEVMAVYRSAAALVFPSLYEGWGLPIVEAFQAGLPVACSNATTLPELVGDAALVFDPKDVAAIADAVRVVWTDEARARALADAGRRRVSCFTWKRAAQTMRAHYRRVAGRDIDEVDSALIAAEGPV